MPKKKKLEKSTSQKAQKNIHKKVEILVTLFIIAIMTFVHFYSFPTQINRTLTANVYKNGDFVDTTTVTIKGEKVSRFRGSQKFYGTFAIECIPETCIPDTNAQISWPRRHGQHQITYYNPGHHPEDTNVIITADGDLKFIYDLDEISPNTDIIDIHIARRMTEFVIYQSQPYNGNCVIATSEHALRTVVELNPYLYDDYLIENQKETLLSSTE